MSVLELKVFSFPVHYPVKFQCDVCKAVFELTDKFDLVHSSDVEHQMAVVRYSTPAGFGDHDFEVHCCSPSCLFEVVKKIPFDASITIPCDGFYHKNI